MGTAQRAGRVGGRRPRGKATRERLLDAALTVLTDRGARGLTLDAVAQQAGISKGGLIHHFPTHDALVEALLERWMLDFEQLVESSITDEEPGAWLRAYLRQTDLAPQTGSGAGPSPESSYAVGLMAAFGHGSQVREALQRVADRTRDRAVNDGVDPAVAMIVCLAADGLWINELLGLSAPRDELREQVLAQLERMTRGQP